MSFVPQGAPAPTAPRVGRGMIIAGSVLIALSVMVGAIGTAVVSRQINVDDFQRDVVVDGPDSTLIPGTLSFRVAEPLRSDADTAMTVGVAVAGTATPEPECTLDRDGEPVKLTAASAGSELLRQTTQPYEVIREARLEPGSYELRCELAGEPSSDRGGNVTVGRVFGTDDAMGLVGPVVIFLLVGALAALLFIIGVILLIVGLVRSSRARRGPPGFPTAPPPSDAPPGPPLR